MTTGSRIFGQETKNSLHSKASWGHFPVVVQNVLYLHYKDNCEKFSFLSLTLRFYFLKIRVANVRKIVLLYLGRNDCLTDLRITHFPPPPPLYPKIWNVTRVLGPKLFLDLRKDSDYFWGSVHCAEKMVINFLVCVFECLFYLFFLQSKPLKVFKVFEDIGI